MKKIIFMLLLLGGFACVSNAFADGVKDNVDLKKQFDGYYSQLLEYRKDPKIQLSSNPAVYNDCEAFRKIVETGKVFLPFIVEEIKKGDFFLNQAMEEITGIKSTSLKNTDEIIGEIEISKLWIEWWEQNKNKFAELK
ncbi:MAG: hypothetical protein HQL25_00050 [Candidatus Omnitrophica bacterium]|nr:hypothetical protein [Candidatus Omnitrophota bacterium]